MKTSWVIGLIMLFIIMTVISGICEMTYLPATEESRLWVLLHPFEGFRSILDLPEMVFDWAVNLWGMFWFDYAFFQNEWIIVKYLFWSISIGLIWSILSTIRGVGSA